MLRELQLANFKAFGEKVRIPIRPLTLIFGANSSGKSSIFQALLLLKQTLEEAQSPKTLLLFKGNSVDLGTYRDIVHRHDVDLNFEVGVQFDQKNFKDADMEKEAYGEEWSRASRPMMRANGPGSLPNAREILNDAGAVSAGMTIKFFKNSNKLDVNVHIGNEFLPLISYAKAPGSKTHMNFDSRFWHPWWRLMKDTIKGTLLSVVHSVDVNGEEIYRSDGTGKYNTRRELEQLLDNYEWKDVTRDLERMEKRLSLYIIRLSYPDRVLVRGTSTRTSTIPNFIFLPSSFLTFNDLSQKTVPSIGRYAPKRIIPRLLVHMQ